MRRPARVLVVLALATGLTACETVYTVAASDWIMLLATLGAALLGSWGGVWFGAKKLRGEMAFIRRLEWYQEATEAALALRYALQEVIRSMDPNAASEEEARRKTWDDTVHHLRSFLEIVPRAHMYARVPTYRVLRRMPFQAKDLVEAMDHMDFAAVDPLARAEHHAEHPLTKFKKEIALSTEALINDLRDHLGLKRLSRRHRVRLWLHAQLAHRKGELYPVDLPHLWMVPFPPSTADRTTHTSASHGTIDHGG